MSNSASQKQVASIQDLDAKWRNFNFTNAIALLTLMQQIQSQKPLDDPAIVMIDKDGTPLY